MMASTPTYGSWHTSATPDDEVRTIFITGFPSDTKERELQNLLRWWPGYEACQLTAKGENPLGFALFNAQSMAVAARDALQGLVFDLETNSTLRAEMAKKNLFVKKGVVPPSPQPLGMSPGYESNKRHRGVEMPGPSYMQPMPPMGYVSSGFEGPPGTVYAYALPSSPAPMPAPMHVPLTHHFSSPSTHTHTPRGGRSGPDNPPCNTLFVGNLGEGVREHELQGVFSVLPGYRQMKILRQQHANVCFIEFADIETAAAAHSSTQGVILPSNERGGLRVQFSKNPFGKKRDGSFHKDSAVGAAAAAAQGDAGYNGSESEQATEATE